MRGDEDMSIEKIDHIGIAVESIDMLALRK
jgi:hypothetical protein